MAAQERIEDLIAPKVLEDFAALNKSINDGVVNLERLIATGVDLNKVFGAGGFKKTTEDTEKLAKMEKELGMQAQALAATQVKLEESYIKLKAAETKAINDNAKALNDEAKAAENSKKAKAGKGSSGTTSAGSKPTEAPKSGGAPPPTDSELFNAQVDSKVVKIQENVADATVKLNASYSAEARALAEVKVQQQLVDKGNKQSAQEALGLIGAFDRLNLQYQALVKNARNIAVELGEDSAEYKAAAAEAGAMGDRLRLIDMDLKQFGRNVGNYAGSLGGALAVLQKDLEAIRQQLAKTGKEDPGFQKLAKQEQLLASLNTNLSKGFSSTRGEMKAYTEAAKQMGLELGIDSNAFISFTEKIGETKNELEDVQSVLKYQSSDTKYLDGAISAVNGLAGAYGAAQGAAQLFGQDNEDLQKSFVKLQAIMTIIQSLQAVQNSLQVESGALQLGMAAKTALLNAALVVETALFGIKAKVVEENIAAQEGNILATGGAAAAMEAEAAATATATAATVTFRTTLISTGIGAILVAIAAGLAYLVSKIPDWIRGTHLSAEEQAALAETVGKANQAILDQADALDYYNKKDQEFIQSQITLAQAAGANQYKQLALQKQLAEVNKTAAKERVDFLKSESKSLDANLSDYRKYVNRRQESLGDLAKLQEKTKSQMTSEEKRQLENWPKLIDVYEKQGAAAKALADAQIKARQDEVDAQLRLDEISTESAKLADDEHRKLVLTTAEVESSIIQNRNALVLSSDKATLAQRLAALRSNAAEQKKVLQAQLNDTLSNPGSTENDKLVAEKEYQGKLTTIQENAARAQYDLRQEYAQRDRQARLLELKTQLDDVGKANDLIADNDKKSFDKRTNAAYLALKARIQVVNIEAEEQLKNQKLTEEERKAILTKAASDVNGLVVEYGQKQLALYTGNEAKITAAIEKEAEKRQAITATSNADKLIALNSKLISGQVTLNAYTRERAKIEADNAVIAAQEAVKAEQAKLAATKEGTAERAKAEEQLAGKVIDLQNAVLNKSKTTQDELLAGLGKIQEFANVAFDLIGGALNASITAQKNALQDQSDAIDKNTAQQIEAINNSADTEERKAARIATVNARAQAQKEAIEKRQRQLDIQKAQFDKARSIANIILNTAIAVVKALHEGGPVLAAVYGAIGAAELAIAIATPLPKFAQGTMDAPGGLSMVGDGGRSEMVVTPDGRLIHTPNTPTVMNVPRHSVVFPDAEEFLRAGMGDGGRVPSIDESRAQWREMTTTLGGKLDNLTRVIKNKPDTEIVKTRDGWEQIKRHNGGGQTRYLNNL